MTNISIDLLDKGLYTITECILPTETNRYTRHDSDEATLQGQGQRL